MKMNRWLSFKRSSISTGNGRNVSGGEEDDADDKKATVSWSKYLVSSGGEIKAGDGEDDHWSADMSKLLIGSRFASGRHSRIYHGIYNEKEVAVKIVSVPEDHQDEALATLMEKQFNSEVSLLFCLKHPNIISFVAACRKPPVYCIIMEYMSGGSLRKFLHQQKPYSLPLKMVLKLALEIARGMNYLHSRGILHRDLKSENILLGDDMTVKVADFGISCLESQCLDVKGFMGTYRWMAPEMINERPHTRKVDVYSFGIVLWELLSALIPFQEMTPEQAAYAVTQKNARPQLPAHCPPALGNFITHCWASNPEKRPHFSEIVSVLEYYNESFNRDPEFFLSCKPFEQRRVLGCVPRLIPSRRSALLFT